MEKSIKSRGNQYHFHLPNFKKAMVMGQKLGVAQEHIMGFLTGQKNDYCPFQLQS
jgi:hypothetical protein